ncbi:MULTISPECIES: hypothetical protein [unclassified Streptomyces]|uniref:effector-associated constant component EACC1 n=1 Tax=unclassified Streptomyces TaxID=2593676 RepID=UPI000380E5EF|nr:MULTISPECIES: hypothetical protein [unclassified Streptomyces]MYT27602.1 hypothetical protein [Streptomyces sp. SID8354]
MRPPTGCQGVALRVRIDSDGAGDGSGSRAEGARLTADFADWLVQDRNVGLHTEIQRVRPDTTDGSMSGDLVEWISLAVSSGFSILSLLRAHRSFRASLPPRLRPGARMVIEIGGVRLVVEDGTEQDAVRIARALAASESESESEADSEPDSEPQLGTESPLPPASAEGTSAEDEGDDGS